MHPIKLLATVLNSYLVLKAAVPIHKHLGAEKPSSFSSNTRSPEKKDFISTYRPCTAGIRSSLDDAWQVIGQYKIQNDYIST